MLFIIIIIDGICTSCLAIFVVIAHVNYIFPAFYCLPICCFVSGIISRLIFVNVRKWLALILVVFLEHCGNMLKFVYIMWYILQCEWVIQMM